MSVAPSISDLHTSIDSHDEAESPVSNTSSNSTFEANREAIVARLGKRSLRFVKPRRQFSENFVGQVNSTVDEFAPASVGNLPSEKIGTWQLPEISKVMRGATSQRFKSGRGVLRR
jgi:hypothetical protein